MALMTFRVWGPMAPYLYSSPWFFWNATTASHVVSPKYPVTLSALRRPCETKKFCKMSTSGSLLVYLKYLVIFSPLPELGGAAEEADGETETLAPATVPGVPFRREFKTARVLGPTVPVSRRS